MLKCFMMVSFSLPLMQLCRACWPAWRKLYDDSLKKASANGGNILNKVRGHVAKLANWVVQ